MRNHQRAVRRIFPKPQLIDRPAEYFFPGVPVPTLECSVYIHEPSFRHRCDGERDRARTKDLLEPVLRLHQRRLRSSKIFYPLFKFLPINRSPFVKTGILDCRCRRDCQQFRPTEMVLREAVGLRMPDRQKTQVLSGRHQRNAQPGAQMIMSFEGLPRLFFRSVGDQDTLLAGQNPLQERRVVGIQSEREFRTRLWSLWAELLS